jgi:phosphatidate cytidylyltransferase
VIPALLTAIGMVVFIAHLHVTVEVILQRMTAFGLSLILFTVPGICALFLTDIRPVLILGIFVMLWSGDVWAYLGGRKFGRRKLAPTVSPNKTWEGVVVGLIATAVAAFVLSRVIPDISLVSWAVMGVLVVGFGTTGDLLQSAIKRAAGVKDSGGLLPGHGGVWDRFDSFLGCVSWIALYYFIV